ncbi:Hypothetical protein ETEE_2130 [Edwardsiella anguillarum ET080813]|uniref:Uncharacterized protein n=1 Tax=Edwardsiella anguillarum ET080813 TaxID=667120 RepID=A0A076LSL0_9GAMM|nr:Hypothetical protein ETEE_2130 [Edwardsiella anguillarum ET080813]
MQFIVCAISFAACSGIVVFTGENWRLRWRLSAAKSMMSAVGYAYTFRERRMVK